MTSAASPHTLKRRELLYALIPVCLLAGLFAFLAPAPAEDACILFRYADHLAGGQGIVWNPGEDPVEGATEFAWMILCAAIIGIGLPVPGAAQALGLAISGLGALALYAGSRRRLGAGPLSALLVSTCYAGSTTVLHAGTGFGTPLYTFFALIGFLTVWRLLDETPPSRNAGRLLAASLLALCLARPEGVYLGALMYGALIAGRPSIAWGPFARDQIALLGVPGILYFAWRWSYFGYPFPNTFYVKVFDGAVNPDSVTRIANFVFHFCLPPLILIGAWLVSLDRPDLRRRLPLCLVPLLYMVCYARFAMIQDVGFRFLFPSFALLLALAAPAFETLVSARVRAGARSPASIGVGIALAGLLAANSLRMIHASGHRGVYDDRYEIGRRLAKIDPPGHVMMPTEAGYLPFLSGWVAVDPLGLNDETVAHEGLTERYIASRNPDLIMFHVDTPAFSERWSPPGADRWEAMTKLMHRYAVQRGYRLVAVIQKSARVSDGYHWYYVRPDAAGAEAIEREILGLPGARYVPIDP